MRSLQPTALIVYIFLSSCVNKTNVKPAYRYDEASLKAFVLSTNTTTDSIGKSQLDTLLDNAARDSTALHQTISYLEVPFSDPNSSFRNQQFYERLLKAKLNSRYYIDEEKQVAEGKLKLLHQNNVGKPANDFIYVTPAGYKKKMYGIKSNFTVLFFNNPECPACKEIKAAFNASAIISDMIKTGDLKILAMYTDQDEKLWLDSLSSYPAKWIAGRDENEYLYKNKVYDLRAIPTIYLLDKQKKVLLKDVISAKEIEEVLVNQKELLPGQH
jgi:thiol-disulfide isomerase/thioredoxin